MKLKAISLKDKAVFDKYLNLERHELSVYAFENIYIWKALCNVEWCLIKKSLCVFLRDGLGSFLYLSPLSNEKDPEVIEEVFKILNKFNKNKNASRIENIEEKDISFYEKSGYGCNQKSSDYLCLRSDLENLKGNKLKSKRSSFNYFVKNNNFEYLPFSLQDKKGCLELYDGWILQRSSLTKDRVYLGMLDDSKRCFELMLEGFGGLNLTGRAVKINHEIRALTFGFPLNTNTFCILYEITDLSVKGLAQFIFAKFSSELKEYKYINIMDDSGLENLKKVKLSYHPVKLISSYIVNNKTHGLTDG